MGLIANSGGCPQTLSGSICTDAFTPPMLNASVNNYAPDGFHAATTVKLRASAPMNITGLLAGSDCELKFLINEFNFAITLKNADVASVAANRMNLGADVVLAANGGAALMMYSSSLGGWQLIGSGSASGGGGATSFGNDWTWVSAADELSFQYPTALLGNWVDVTDNGVNGTVTIAAHGAAGEVLLSTDTMTVRLDETGQMMRLATAGAIQLIAEQYIQFFNDEILIGTNAGDPALVHALDGVAQAGQVLTIRGGLGNGSGNAGGALNLAAGFSGSGAANAGAASLVGGDAQGSGAGGNLTLAAGMSGGGGTGVVDGAKIRMFGGGSGAGGSGGNIELTGGDAGGASANKNGGDIVITGGTPTGTGTVGALRMTAGSFAVAQSAAAPAIAAAGTITTKGIGSARLAPAAAVAGIIMQAGAFPGQKITVINQSAAINTVTMAVAATSNVANGVACVIAGLTAKSFTWNSVTNLWYPES